MKKFKLGALSLSPVFDGTKPVESLWDTIELASHLESFGYSRYWIAEHHSPRVAHSSPELLVSIIAGVTKTIRIGTGGILLRLRSPLKVAEDFRLLNALYPGRIDLGIARGGGGAEESQIGGESCEPFEERTSSLLTYLRDSASDVASPTGIDSPEVWMLGSNTTSMHLAARHGTAFCFAHFLARSEVDPMSVVAAYYSTFIPSTHLKEAKCCVAFAGVCGASDAVAQGLLPPNVPYKIARTIIGGSEQWSREFETWNKRLQVTEFLFLDMCRQLNDKVNSCMLLAQSMP